MKLVEIIPAIQTSPEVLARARAFGAACGKGESLWGRGVKGMGGEASGEESGEESPQDLSWHSCDSLFVGGRRARRPPVLAVELSHCSQSRAT
jgi:hypothetical protein